MILKLSKFRIFPNGPKGESSNFYFFFKFEIVHINDYHFFFTYFVLIAPLKTIFVYSIDISKMKVKLSPVWANVGQCLIDDVHEGLDHLIRL